MATTTATYRPAGTSAFERTNTPTDCGHCERTGLKTTVKMVDPSGVIVWMGTGCATKAMGMPAAEFNKLRKAADAEATDIDRRARQIAADAADVRWQAFLDGAAGPGDRIEQIRRLGGITEARRGYRAQGGAW